MNYFDLFLLAAYVLGIPFFFAASYRWFITDLHNAAPSLDRDNQDRVACAAAATAYAGLWPAAYLIYSLRNPILSILKKLEK